MSTGDIRPRRAEEVCWVAGCLPIRKKDGVASDENDLIPVWRPIGVLRRQWWRASFPKLRHEIGVGSVLRHAYLNRLLDDRGNAEESFVFDLGQFEWLGSSEATEDPFPWVEVN